jgi:hypothetical protein
MHFDMIPARTSTRLFLASGALAIVAIASTGYAQKVQSDFARQTTIAMGTVQKKGALLGRARRSQSEWFCWVSYEFTPPEGGARRNWRFWEPACGVSPGRPIPIQYVVADPGVNRPAGSEPSFPAWLFFFAAGVTMVVALLVRGHRQQETG